MVGGVAMEKAKAATPTGATAVRFYYPALTGGGVPARRLGVFRDLAVAYPSPE